MGGNHRITVPLTPLAESHERVATVLEGRPGGDPQEIVLPARTLPIDINWCTALQTLPGLPAAVRNFQICNRPDPTCQSVGGVVEVCGTLTEMRTTGWIKVGGSLDANFNVTPGGITLPQLPVFSPCNRIPKIPDLCSITGVCIPGAPVLVQAPLLPIFYPCNVFPAACSLTPGVCIPGAPVLVQAFPPKFETCKVVRAAVSARFETCRQVSAGTPLQVTLPALAEVYITGAHILEAQLTNVIAGRGSVEVQVPVPALAFTAGATTAKKSGTSGKSEDEDPLVQLEAIVRGGLFLYLRGEASNTRLTVDASANSHSQIDLSWNPSRGWLDRSRVLANDWRAGIKLDTPEKIILRAGIRPQVSTTIAMKVKDVDAVNVALTHHVTPYLEDIWTRPPDRNWRHDVDAGIQLFQQATLQFPQIPASFLGLFPPSPTRTILQAVNTGLNYTYDEDLLRVDTFDLFGRGDLQVRVNATGALPGTTFGVGLEYIKPAAAPLRNVSAPLLHFTGVAPGATVRFSQHPQVRDFKSICEVDPAIGSRPATSFNCELIAEEHMLRVDAPAGCAVAGLNPRRIRLKPDEVVTETIALSCMPGATPGGSASGDSRILPWPETLLWEVQAGASFAPSKKLAVAGASSSFSARPAGGQGWLRIDPVFSTTPAGLNVSVIPAGLSPGEYRDSISLESPSQPGVRVHVPVLLRVTAAPRAVVSPEALQLESSAGVNGTAWASLAVTSSGAAAAFTATASGGTWLSVTPGSGSLSSSASSSATTLSVSARAAGLAPGKYTGSIRITTAGGATTVPVTFVVRSNRLTIAQVVDGADWKTTIILVNTDDEPASFTVRFFNAAGASTVFDLRAGGLTREYSAWIPVNGSHVIETGGTTPTLKQGWADVTSDQSIGGRAIFRYRDANGRDSEAAVPLSASSRQTILLPFDNTLGFATSAAFLNPSGTTAALTLRFRDERGALISTGSMSVAALNRQAFALATRFAAVANRKGVAEISVTGAEISVLGLRFNPRGAFTSFESIGVEAVRQGTVTRAIAQIADGASWKTTLALVNNGPEPAKFSLAFRNANGAGLRLPIVGLGDVIEISETIPAGGSRVLETVGASAALLQGWAELTTPDSIGGVAVFRLRGSNGLDSEAAVQIVSNPGSRFVLPFDNTGGFVTSIAALNDTYSTARASIIFRDEEGRLISEESFTLAAKGRAAFALAQRFSRLVNRRGTAEFSAGPISVLGLRFNPLGSFTSLAPVRK